MTHAASTLATIDSRPFFVIALRYGVNQKIISLDRLHVIQDDLAKGIVQIANFFSTAHLRPELELALHRMVNLISLYLENISGGNLQNAAASLRDNTLLSHSKAGADMLKRLQAMPDNTQILGSSITPEDQRAYLDEKTAAHSINQAEYLSQLTSRQENQNLIDFSFWLAKKMDVSRDSVEEADSLIHSAMLVLFVDKAELKIPTPTTFVHLIESARHKKSKLNEIRFEAVLKEAPTEFENLARREMNRFIEKELPQIRAPGMTADKLLHGDSISHFFTLADLDGDSRKYDRLVAKEWDRVTHGDADDPAVLATVFLLIATGLAPKASLLLREAKEIIQRFRQTGFNTQAVLNFIEQNAPEALRESLQKTWLDEIKTDAEDHLTDDNPDRPDSHMERAVEYLRTSCSATWKRRGR
jgi:hypothetical protein